MGVMVTQLLLRQLSRDTQFMHIQGYKERVNDKKKKEGQGGLVKELAEGKIHRRGEDCTEQENISCFQRQNTL